MNNFHSEYKQKLISVSDAVGLVKSGDVITASSGMLGPLSIMRQLHTASEWAENLTVLSSMSVEEYPFLCDPQYKDTFTIDCSFTSASERVAYSRKTASYFPAHLHNSAIRWITRHKPSIFYGVATPMDKHGYMRLSCSLIHELECIEAADLVVLEINPNHPRTHGETLIHVRDVNYLVETDTPVPYVPNFEIEPDQKVIGQYISELIHDGDCIQLGIGGIPDSVAASLMDKKDLGIHTEMITSRMADLINAGVVNGKKKTLHPGKVVAVFAVGDENLFDTLDDNPSIYLNRASYVNDLRVMSKNDNLVSINTALSCDLTGQISSEAIGTRQYSGTGGQSDTASAANHAKNGRSIIAIRSTRNTKNGLISNIKAVHEEGTAITLSRNEIDYVVTEHGVAPLKGLSIRDRIGNLIAVAHPDFREELKKDAQKYYM